LRKDPRVFLAAARSALWLAHSHPAKAGHKGPVVANSELDPRSPCATLQPSHKETGQTGPTLMVP
jgi:hypothetical protein